MAKAHEFRVTGIVPIILMPFTADEQVDWRSLRRLGKFACAAGSCAMCLPGYASKFYKLSDAEILRVIAEAVQQAAGRVPVFAQINFVSTTQAVKSAREAQRPGASAIAVAVPRIFAVSEIDFYRYFDRILSSIDIPLLIQDVNPLGPTVTARFVAELYSVHPHFRWIKLAEPLMLSKVVALSQTTVGEVGALEGWGGIYMLDLIPSWICGVMPGLAVFDLLAKVFQLATDRDMPAAYKILRAVLPQSAFSLQHMELFHHAEKGLMARCVLEGAIVRQLTLRLNEHLENHMSFLNRQVLALLDRLDLPHNPILATTAGKAGTHDRGVGARGWDQDRDRCRRRCATQDRLV